MEPYPRTQSQAPLHQCSSPRLKHNSHPRVWARRRNSGASFTGLVHHGPPYVTMLGLHHLTPHHHQASYYDKLLSSGLLTPPEIQLLTWAQSEQPATYRARFTGSTAAMEKYRKGTAFEALVSGGAERWFVRGPLSGGGRRAIKRACVVLPFITVLGSTWADTRCTSGIGASRVGTHQRGL